MRSNPTLKTIIVAVIIIILILIVGGITLGANKNSTNDVPKQNIVSSNSISSLTAFVDDKACKIITPAIIKEKVGLTVEEGKATPVLAQGSSTCIFKSGDGFSNVITIQIYPEMQYGYSNYQPSTWTGITEVKDVGDKAFFQNPVKGISNAQAVKAGTEVFLNIISSNDSYKGDQVKELLKSVVDKL